MKTLLLPLLLLIVGTGTAFAEGAWVLWEEERWLDAGAVSSEIGIILSDGRKVKDQPWLMRDSFPNEAACEQGLAKEIKRLSSKKHVVELEGNKVLETVMWRDGLEWRRVLHYICLPDPGVRDPNAVRYRR